MRFGSTAGNIALGAVSSWLRHRGTNSPIVSIVFAINRPLKRIWATMQQFARHTVGSETADGHTRSVGIGTALGSVSETAAPSLTTHWALLGSVRELRAAVSIKAVNATRVRYADGILGSGRSSGTILVDQGTSSGTILVDYGGYFRERFS